MSNEILELKELKELKEELQAAMEDVDFQTFGFATDVTTEKSSVLLVLNKMERVREILIENTDSYPNGLSKISWELDDSDSKEVILKEVENLIFEISEVSEKENTHLFKDIKEDLFSEVCKQIRKDVKFEDFTSLYELLKGVPKEHLLSYLSEDVSNAIK